MRNCLKLYIFSAKLKNLSCAWTIGAALLMKLEKLFWFIELSLVYIWTGRYVNCVWNVEEDSMEITKQVEA